MKKLFVIADPHGHFDVLKPSLDKAGFDENNPDHILVGCGDYIDRGAFPMETIKYLHNLPNKVLVRGNHEDLFEDCCRRGEPYLHDAHNGTYQTIMDIAKADPYNYGYFPDAAEYALKKTKPFRDSLVNYFETKNYIFVHSWIPVISKDGRPAHHLYDRSFEFDPNWRDANQKEWDSARWGNPFAMAARGLNQTGKTIVFGHWHCSAGWAEDESRSEFGPDAKFEIYFGKDFIGLDTCTAHTKKINVLVLEDELC